MLDRGSYGSNLLSCIADFASLNASNLAISDRELARVSISVGVCLTADLSILAFVHCMLVPSEEVVFHHAFEQNSIFRSS